MVTVWGPPWRFVGSVWDCSSDGAATPTHAPHLLEVPRIFVQILDERRHVVERRRAVVMRFRLPLDWIATLTAHIKEL